MHTKVKHSVSCQVMTSLLICPWQRSVVQGQACLKCCIVQSIRLDELNFADNRGHMQVESKVKYVVETIDNVQFRHFVRSAKTHVSSLIEFGIFPICFSFENVIFNGREF